MERKEVIISDLAAAVREKELLAPLPAADTWEAVPYATVAAAGTLLAAGPKSFPAPVTVDPGLSGWYRIYICLGGADGSQASRVDLQLTGDEFAATARCCDIRPYTRLTFDEFVEESLWKAADLTGKTITIRKNNDGLPNTSCVLWLRFEPMTDEEVSAHTARLADNSRRTMWAHMDGDHYAFDMAKEPHDYCKVIHALSESDVEIIAEETMFDLTDFEACSREFARSDRAAQRNAYMKAFDEKKEAIYREQIAYAHACGMRMHAAPRMGIGSFTYPWNSPLFRIPFADAHPEWRCRTRDGFNTGYLSYAFPQVQDFVLEHVAQGIRYGFDGVSLLFSRGLQVMFEQPVIDRFAEKYGAETDCRRLSLDDPRLTGIWSDIMTEFMVRVRQKLNAIAADDGRPVPEIYVTGCYDMADNLHQGLDIERWAKNGLIDGVIQSKIIVWEDLEGVLAADGFIDLAAYTKKANTTYVVNRQQPNDPALLAAGVAEYRRVADETGIRLFSELQWENTVQAEEYLAAAKEIFKNGGQSIALWDCYPGRNFVRSEWDCVHRLGVGEEALVLPDAPEHWHRIYRMLISGDADVRHVTPNWRG